MRTYKYILIIILLISFSIIIPKIINKRTTRNIFFDENFLNITESFNKAKNFLDKCLTGILIQNKTINLFERPIVSVVIPLYNREKYISRAIKSIQNQNMINLEIILVNDFSLDNTLSIIEEIKREEPRIKILNNKKNMGTLFSRSIGVLSAKGKYIFHLDSDDMYLDEDIFSVITNIAIENNIDIISFKGMASFYDMNKLSNKIREYWFTPHKSNNVLYQPELGLLPLIPGTKLGSFLIKDSTLCNKCIKTDVYQKVLNKIGRERYSRYMILDEDRTIIYALFNVAESMKYVKKYGILIISLIGSTARRSHKFSEIFLYKLYFCDIAIQFAKESYKSRKPLINLIVYLLENKALREITQSNEYNKKLIKSCIKRVLNYTYISNEDKEEIRKRASKLEFLKEIRHI